MICYYFTYVSIYKTDLISCRINESFEFLYFFLLWFSVLCVIDLAWGGSDSFSVLGTYGAGFITPPWLNENSMQSFLCRSRGVPEPR